MDKNKVKYEIKFPPRDVKVMKELIDKGKYKDYNDFIRTAVKKLLKDFEYDEAIRIIDEVFGIK